MDNKELEFDACVLVLCVTDSSDQCPEGGPGGSGAALHHHQRQAGQPQSGERRGQCQCVITVLEHRKERKCCIVINDRSLLSSRHFVL